MCLLSDITNISLIYLLSVFMEYPILNGLKLVIVTHLPVTETKPLLKVNVYICYLILFIKCLADSEVRGEIIRTVLFCIVY